MRRQCLISMAVLAAAGAASAQSSVTVFGVIDTAISRYAVDSAFYDNTVGGAVPPAVAPAGARRSQTAMSSGGYSGARLGFRGTEDLGGGLAAGFWLESGLNTDDGRGMSSFNRRSTASLSGAWGEIRMGRDYTPTFRNDILFDPFAASGVGTHLNTMIGGNLTVVRGPGSAVAATDNYARTGNSIAYFLPAHLGGLYGQLQYSFHENAGGAGSKKGRFAAGRLGYASGPLEVAAAYSESMAADGVVDGIASRSRIKVFNMGATYDFGPAKLLGQFTRMDDSLQRAGGAVPGYGRYTGALLGVTVPAGPGFVRASYAQVRFDNDAALPNTASSDASARKLALGYVYTLSKRTLLYATAAHVRIRNGENNAAIMGATTGGSAAFLFTGGGMSGFAPRSATGYEVGINHSF